MTDESWIVRNADSVVGWVVGVISAMFFGVRAWFKHDSRISSLERWKERKDKTDESNQKFQSETRDRLTEIETHQSHTRDDVQWIRNRLENGK